MALLGRGYTRLTHEMGTIGDTSRKPTRAFLSAAPDFGTQMAGPNSDYR